MKEKLFETIDALFQTYLKVWEDVCNLESPTEDKNGVDQVGAYFINRAKEMGWKVEVFPQEVAGDVVTITMNENSAKAPLTFSGHIDTVFRRGAFGVPAVKMDKERIYGPGVTDCKGGVVAGFFTMHALKELGFTDRPIRLILQTDEETGSITSGGNTIKYMCDKAKDSIAFINLEGGTYGEACLVRKGILTVELDVTGQEAHSSRCALFGANAIAEASHKIIDLEKFKDNDGITCNCAIISGGTKVNVVPGKCKVLVNIRFATEEQYKYILDYVNELAKVEHVKGCTTTVKIDSVRPSMELVDRNVALLKTMNEIFVKYGISELKLGKRTGGSDAAYVTRAGIPCVDSIGVKGAHIHSTNEYADIESLRDSVQRLTMLACEI